MMGKWWSNLLLREDLSKHRGADCWWTDVDSVAKTGGPISPRCLATGTCETWSRTARATSVMTMGPGQSENIVLWKKTSFLEWVDLNTNKFYNLRSYGSSYADEVPLSASVEKYVYRRNQSGTSPKIGHFFLNRWEIYVLFLFQKVHVTFVSSSIWTSF